jgi:predicted nicotinamide N-methyase
VAGAAAPIAEFIRSCTTIAAPPLIPEITLHLSGDEPTVLWEHTERETGRADLPPPFWAYPWAGGIALARYLLDHPERAAGRVVLDLASGSGLVAIAAARAGAARVIASDIDPMAVAAITLNAAVNGVEVVVTDADLLTGDAAAAALLGGAGMLGGATSFPAPDLVVVGDACYERRMAHRMLAFLRRAQSSGASALLGDPGRTYLPATGLRPLASYVVPAWPGLEDTEVKQSTVWQLDPPAEPPSPPSNRQ